MVGNHRVTEPVHLCCGTESISVINLNLDRTSPGIHIQFPVESSDVVDVRELQENYSKEIRKEFDKALQNIEMGHLGKAADRLRKVVKSAPDFYRARVMLGMVYHRAGCYLDAEREYLKAREISPQSTSSMINLGSLYIQIASTRLVENRNFTKEAIDLFNQAIPIKPRAALPYFLIGAAYYEDKSFGPAIEHLNGSLEKLNSVPEAHLLLADIYKQQEKWKEALEHLDAYLEENEYSGNQPEIKNLRKEILARLKSEK
jgi:tetratricopeptide (TPR) repeat protein